MAEVDDRAHDHLVLLVEQQVGDEAAVDLQLGHRQVTQVAQRRVPGAEVVHRQPHTGAVQPLDRLAGTRGVVQQGGLGDLQRQQRGVHAVAIQAAQHPVGQQFVEQVVGAQVDGQAEVVAHPVQAAGLLDRSLQHHVGELLDEAGLLRHRHEVLRADGAAVVVAPPGQRLHPDDHAAGQVQLRLQVHLQVALVQRGAQVAEHGQPCGRAPVDVLAVRLDPGVTVLRRVHGDVGPAQQGAGIVVAVLQPGDADADGDHHVQPVDGERLAHLLQQTAGQFHGFLRGGPGEHGELVAGQAGQHVVGAQQVVQSLAERRQQGVAGDMTEGVVDLLEPVHVHQQHRPGPLAAGQAGRQQALERGAVGQAGERVVAGLELDALVEHRLAQAGGHLIRQRAEAQGVHRAELVGGALAAGEDERAHQTVAVADRSHQYGRGDGVVAAAGGGRQVAVQHQAAVTEQEGSPHGVVHRVGQRGQALAVAMRARPPGAVEDDDRGSASPEQAAGLVGGGGGHRVQPEGLVDGSDEPQLGVQVSVPLLQPPVRPQDLPAGQQWGHADHGQPAGDQRGRHRSSADGAAHRGDPPGQAHLAGDPRPPAALHHRDRSGDQHRPHHRGDRRGRDHGDDGCARPGPHPLHQLEDVVGDRQFESEQGAVEHQLVAPGAEPDQQHRQAAQRSRGDGHPGWQVEQREGSGHFGE